MAAENRRQCLLLSLETLVRNGTGTGGRGQSGGGVVEVAVKRSMAIGLCGCCFFRKSKGKMRMLDWVVGWIGLGTYLWLRRCWMLKLRQMGWVSTGSCMDLRCKVKEESVIRNKDD